MVSVLQACVLLLFNCRDSMSVVEIMEALECEFDYLKKELAPLLASKIIQKHSPVIHFQAVEETTVHKED